LIAMRLYRPMLIVALLLAFGVILLGAYVRLSDAGLGCPDWPGCYGHLFGVPDAAQAHTTSLGNYSANRVDAPKAWKEMLHRYFAGTLGLLILLITFTAWSYRRPLQQSPAVPCILLGTVGLQALLGMWTVTLQLKPVIVTAHLLGGMTTLALLVWLNLAQYRQDMRSAPIKLRWLAMLSVFVLVTQIMLGGWVSSNYAGLACGNEFPGCLGTLRPATDFAQAFELHRKLGLAADGSALASRAVIAIHWAHRIGALVVALTLGLLSIFLLCRSGWRSLGLLLVTALLAQIGLGVANVQRSLPLHVAVAHSAGAAILLAVTLVIAFRLWHAPGQGLLAAGKRPESPNGLSPVNGT